MFEKTYRIAVCTVFFFFISLGVFKERCSEAEGVIMVGILVIVYFLDVIKAELKRKTHV